MAKKIAKTLLIGLGGTGVSTLKYAKKRFFETYANEEEIAAGVESFSLPMVEYLAIDTSITELQSGLPEDESVKLKSNECFHASVSNPLAIINQTPSVNDWMIKKNTDNPEAIVDGAHQVRQYGRLSFMYNYSALKNEIESKINKLSSYQLITDSRYQFLDGSDSKVNVVFCFSVAGGTGSGTFLDIAYLTKSLEYITTQAYLVLPDIFDKEIKIAIAKTNIYPNGYAALRELDYCMENKFNKDIKLTENISIPYIGRPFNKVYLISSDNMNGDKCARLGHILELIGNNIVFKSTYFFNSRPNNAYAHGYLNYPKLDKQGTQTPRYLGLGYSELKYDTEIYVNFLKTSYSKFLMDQIQDSNNRVSEQELDSLVTDWEIKEHETDLLIDSILPSNIGCFVVEGNGYNGSETLNRLKQEGENWLSSQKTRLNKKADDQLDNLYQNKTLQTVDFIKYNILNRGGIKTAHNMISLLKGDHFMRLYESEMHDEISVNYINTNRGIKELIVDQNTQLTNKYNELSEVLNGEFFGKKSRCLPIIEDVINYYNILAKLNSELIRREKAILFYSRLHLVLSSLSDELKTFENKIKENHTLFSDKIKSIRSSIQQSQANPFVINLLENDIINNKIENAIVLVDFIDGKNLYDILHEDNNSILGTVDKHICSLSSIVNAKQNSNITTYLENLPNQSSRQDLFNKLDIMAIPLFDVDLDLFRKDIQLPGGEDGWMQSELWGVNNTAHPMFNEINTSPRKETQSINSKSIISVSKMNYPAPMFALKNMDVYHSAYVDSDKNLMSCDLDKRLTKQMNKDKFEIVQKSEADKGHMFAWVFGCILDTLSNGEKGIKRSENGKYEIYNEEHGTAINKNRISLEHSRRDQAFLFFTENNYSDSMRNDFFKEFDSLCLEDKSQLLLELKDHNIYFERYAGIGRNINDIIRAAPNNPNDQNLLDSLNGELELLAEMNIDSIREY